MKENQITVLIKRPGEDAELEPLFPNKLEAFQQMVGGYIETLTIAEDCCIICNEEGRLRGLPYNGELLGMDFVGTIMLVGINGDEFASVPGPSIPMLRSTLNRMNEKD